MTQVVISDFDGTLCDTRAAISTVLSETFRFYGQPVPDGDAIDATLSSGVTLEETFRRLRPELADDVECAAWVKVYRKIYNDGLGVAATREFPNVGTLLSELSKREIPVVIVSNKGEEAVHNTLRFLGMDNHVHSVVAAKNDLATKPDPRSFVDRIQPLFPDLSPANFLVVGDTRADIDYARAIGAPVAWVSYGYGDAVGCQALEPDYIVGDPAEVLTIVADRAEARRSSNFMLTILEAVDDFTSESPLKAPFEAFSDPAANPRSARAAIEAMTRTLLATLGPKPDLLVPIARAGMAMFTVAEDMFAGPAACFAIGIRKKGTNEVAVCLSTSPPAAKRILILDTVIATGDTVLSVAGRLRERYPDAQIVVAACYAAPDAIKRITACGIVHHLTVAVRASSCDDGWLIPKINGDAGEKLYGNLTAVKP